MGASASGPGVGASGGNAGVSTGPDGAGPHGSGGARHQAEETEKKGKCEEVEDNAVTTLGAVVISANAFVCLMLCLVMYVKRAKFGLMAEDKDEPVAAEKIGKGVDDDAPV